MIKQDFATVSDILNMMKKLEDGGLGDYVVTCNDEYTLALKDEEPELCHKNKTIDLGGYD